MPRLVILKWQPFKYKAKFKESPHLFRSEIDIFDIFFKRLYEESFEDLQINSNCKFQTRITMSHVMTGPLTFL